MCIQYIAFPWFYLFQSKSKYFSFHRIILTIKEPINFQNFLKTTQHSNGRSHRRNKRFRGSVGYSSPQFVRLIPSSYCSFYAIRKAICKRTERSGSRVIYSPYINCSQKLKTSSDPKLSFMSIINDIPRNKPQGTNKFWILNLYDANKKILSLSLFDG